MPTVDSVTRRGARASVREVCLLGISRAAAGWESGERLRWGGRSYRVVESVQRQPSSLADEERTRYLYLAAQALVDTGRTAG